MQAFESRSGAGLVAVQRASDLAASGAAPVAAQAGGLQLAFLVAAAVALAAALAARFALPRGTTQPPAAAVGPAAQALP